MSECVLQCIHTMNEFQGCWTGLGSSLSQIDAKSRLRFDGQAQGQGRDRS
jgi:hypothetical protein